jgi:hypothetical protein
MESMLPTMNRLRRNVAIDTLTAVNEVYDPVSNTWASRKPMPVPRAAMAAGTLHGQIQIWGGEAQVGARTLTRPALTFRSPTSTRHARAPTAR